MCPLIGVGNTARHLRGKRFGIEKGKKNRLVITSLPFKLMPVYRPAVQSWRRSGLKAASHQAEVNQLVCQPH